MHPIEILSQEHRVIEARLDELELEIQALEAGQPLRRDWFEETLDFFRDFADRRHHAKEENLLFPRMKQRGVPEQGGPIGVMLAEHDEGRGYLKAIRRNLADAAVMADARGFARAVEAQVAAFQGEGSMHGVQHVAQGELHLGVRRIDLQNRFLCGSGACNCQRPQCYPSDARPQSQPGTR